MLRCQDGVVKVVNECGPQIRAISGPGKCTWQKRAQWDGRELPAFLHRSLSTYCSTFSFALDPFDSSAPLILSAMSAEDSEPVSSRTRASEPAFFPLVEDDDDDMDFSLATDGTEDDSQHTQDTESDWDGIPFHGISLNRFREANLS